MEKTLFYRIFGWGRVPKRYSSTLKSEGIILLDEGIGGSITFKNFRAPWRYHSWKRNWFTGCLVLTPKTFAAFSIFKPLIYIPLDWENLSKLECTRVGSEKLLIVYDASVFNEKWSGTVECRFNTSKAQKFLDRLC